METQDELKLEIGNEEAATLKPAIVKIMDVKVEEVGTKKSRKVICPSKHPDAEELINISAVKFESKRKLDTVGLWINKDSKGLIRKGSALAVFMQSQGCKTIDQLKGRDVMTISDEKGYLCFKAY